MQQIVSMKSTRQPMVLKSFLIWARVSPLGFACFVLDTWCPVNDKQQTNPGVTFTYSWKYEMKPVQEAISSPAKLTYSTSLMHSYE